jgi:stage II sporulation protein AB (anti-sigma F factor)
MALINQIQLSIRSLSENVSIARLAAAAFASQAELTLNEIEEIKVAVSEAVSNAVIHGYGHRNGQIELVMNLYGDKLEYRIIDYGKGIADLQQARKPSYSSDPERMGLGFVFMESFMDEVNVQSAVDKGTTVNLVKHLPLDTAH